MTYPPRSPRQDEKPGAPPASGDAPKASAADESQFVTQNDESIPHFEESLTNYALAEVAAETAERGPHLASDICPHLQLLLVAPARFGTDRGEPPPRPSRREVAGD